MANFGADIISRASDRRGEYVDRMFRQAHEYEQGRQFDQTQKNGKDLSMSERDLIMIQRAQAGDTSPEVKAYIKARDAMETGKTTYSPDAYGNVRAVPAANPFDMLMGSATGGFVGDRTNPEGAIPDAVQRQGIEGIMPDKRADLPGTGANPDDILAMLGTQGGADNGPTSDSTFDRLMMPQLPTDQRPDPMTPLNEDQFAQMALTGQAPKTLPQASGAYQNSPVGDIETGKANTEVQKAGSMLPAKQAEKQIDVTGNIDQFKAQKDYENAITQANDALKTDQGKQKVTTVLSRMSEINDLLKSKDAIVYKDMPFEKRAQTFAATTGVGQMGRKVSDPEAQALADEYTKLQSTLLPFYAAAAGLGAKSLDSDGERRAILGSFGDPAGIYESNKNQIGNLYKMFDTAPPGAQNPPAGNKAGWSIKRKN